MRNLAKVKYMLEHDWKQFTDQFTKNPDMPRDLKIKAQMNYDDWLFSYRTVVNILPKQIENAEQNKLLSFHGPERHSGKWTGKTAIAVAFGPSLRKNISVLMQMRNKYKIIAVDRSFNYLMNRGIKPDYCSALDIHMDPKHIGKHSTEGITLFCHAGTNHDFVRTWVERGGDVCMFVTQERLKSHDEINHVTGINFDVLPIAGNVGMGIMYLALDVLRCKKLLLVGYDNSFDGKWYYPDQRERRDITKLVEEKQAEMFPAITGEAVYSDGHLLAYNRFMYMYLSYRGYFDRVCNCTEGGILHIPQCDRLVNYL